MLAETDGDQDTEHRYALFDDVLELKRLVWSAQTCEVKVDSVHACPYMAPQPCILLETQSVCGARRRPCRCGTQGIPDHDMVESACRKSRVEMDPSDEVVRELAGVGLPTRLSLG